MNIADLIRNVYKVAIEPAYNLIFPKSCHICGTRLNINEGYVCSTCMARLPRTLFHRMPMNPMEQRFAGKFPFERGTGHFFYSSESNTATLIRDLKYHHFRGLAVHLGEVVAKELLPTSFFSDVDAIMPIPMHLLKKARRGYNQTEEIAKGISSILSIPILNNLQASKPHKTQTKLTAQQRLSNLAGTFTVINPAQLENRHILLLDDVCTTGATLTTAADTLLSSAPTLRLTLLTLAVTT